MSYEETLRNVSLNADSSVGIWTGVPGQPGSAVPNNGKQYCLVKVTGKDQVGLTTAAGDAVMGVLQSKPQHAGDAATVAIDGITNVVAGGAISAGAELVSDAQGRAVAIGGTPSGGKRLIAIGIAAGAGEIIPALFL